MRVIALALVAAAMGACSPPQPTTSGSATQVEPAQRNTIPPVPPAAPLPTDAWIGRWPGVEGNYLDISAGSQPGTYAIEEGTLDGTLTYTGQADGEVVRFEQGGRAQALRAGNGDATGLKWLFGKQNCLIIESGRGFCKD